MSILTEDFISYDNPYMVAAIEKGHELSSMVQSAFSTSTKAVDTIIPIFSSVAEGIVHKVDKFASMGKGGQALNDKPGMQYGGENLVVGLIRKARKAVTPKPRKPTLT